MTHLFVTNDFPPKVGGIQTMLWELWRRLDPSTFAVLTTPYEGDASWDANQAYRVVRTKEKVLLPTPSLVRRVDDLADELGASLVVLDPALPLGLIGPRLRHPYAVVLHGAEITVPGRLPGSNLVLRHVLRGAQLDDLVFEAALFPGALELNEQALAQIARADAGRVKALDEQEHRLEIILRDAGIERHLFRRDLEEAVVVDVADDQFGRLPIVRIQGGLVKLTHEVLLKGFLGRDGIEEELAFFLIVLRTGAVAARLRHVIAPFVVQFRQLIELGLELLVRGRRGRFFGAIRVRFGGQLFQDRVGFHFLLNQVPQLEERRLEDEQALLELGRKNLLEREVLRLMHPGAGHDYGR